MWRHLVDTKHAYVLPCVVIIHGQHQEVGSGPAKMLSIPALAVECIVIFTHRFAGRGCTLEMSDEGVGQQLCVQFKSILTQGFNAEPRLVDPDETAPVALGKLGIIP